MSAASIGRRSRRLIDGAFGHEDLYASPVSYLEIASLMNRRRIKVAPDLRTWRQALLDNGLKEWPVTGEISLRAGQLMPDHGDPFDRLILATALMQSAALVASDTALLNWRGRVRRQNAKE